MNDGGVYFTLNGHQHIVPNNVHPATRLSDYIRQVAQLKGTKVMCREGGCGVCVVTVQYTDRVTNRDRTRAINSCLCPIYIAKGWNITTTEGLGAKQKGFHPIQQRMADNCATQCGFCTPGFVMSMYGLLKENVSPSIDDVTKTLDGNLCRCTGYRSIMDALTSFSNEGQHANPIDIEDLEKLSCVKKQDCKHSNPQNMPVIFKNWQRPQNLEQLYQLMDVNPEKRIRLVFGNTASGVYKKDRYDLFIVIRDISELNTVSLLSDTLEVGANVTLSDLQEIFSHHQETSGFGYLRKFSDFISLIANKPVRNSGSWAGNLMMQVTHPNFMADMLPPLDALGAKIRIGCSSGEKWIRAQNLLKEDMSTKVILSVRLPAIRVQEIFSVYKVMPRRQGAHGYLTAAFRIAYNEDLTTRDVSLVFGGFNLKDQHMPETERFLLGKVYRDATIGLACLQILATEISEATGLEAGEYKIQLGQHLLYKFLCNEDGTKMAQPRLERPLSSSCQEYETFPEQYPITQFIPKLAGALQASGEVVYLDDIPVFENELVGLLVLSTIGKGYIDKVDTSAALSVPGVIDVVTARDIPGKNCAFGSKLLAENEVEFNGQPVAVIIAEDLGVAYRALGLVRVTYKNVEKPVVDLEDAIQRGDVLYEVEPQRVGDTKAAMEKCEHVIKGEVRHSAQYHFYLENQGCLVVPHEERYQVWASTQTTDLVQSACADAIGVNASSVTVTAPRVGGGFGGKIIFATHFAALGSVAAHKTNRPVRINPSLETCMKVAGHRPNVLGTYKVGVDETGSIQALETHLYWDGGHTLTEYNEALPTRNVRNTDGVYSFPNMLGTGQVVKTNRQVPTSMRGAGQIAGHLVAETMMEHVAFELGVDPVTLKQKHLCRQGQLMMCGDAMPSDNIQRLWVSTLESADVRKRQKLIEAFNKEHKWIKRGLSMSPGKYLIKYETGRAYTVYMAVYEHDGSVIITHGGVEYGQGLDTKVTQIVMKMLGIPQQLIKFVSSNSVTAPNTHVTAGSITSEYICRTTQECCKSLLAKLEPIKQKHPEADWKTLVHEAHMTGVHMAITEKYVSPTKKTLDYPSLGVLVAEAEVDILTGESQILRADVHMDVGQSVNPAVDIGQVEGALITGLGLMLSEREVIDHETGQMLSTSTWDYKPPTASDIPADLRVNLLKGNPNTLGVFSCKALGEPPVSCTPAFLLAVKAAVVASRKERGRTQHFQLDAPASPADVLRACDVSSMELV